MGKTDRVKLSTKKHGRRKLYHGNRFTRKIVEEMEEVEQQQSATTPTPQPENTAIQQEENISEHPKKTLVSAAKVQKIVTDIPTQNDPKIMDVEVMSRYRKACKLTEPLKKTVPVAHVKWLEAHDCKLNHKGSAGAMEVKGIKKIYSHSINERGLRYVRYLSDGDSKGFETVR